jgi:hypothetical protein
MTDWPYPSFADRRWLGGERGADPVLAHLVRAVRALVADTGGGQAADPDALLHALGQVADLAERADWALLSLVGELRCAGATWATIGAALGVTKQAAQQRFAGYVAQALEQAGSAPRR